MTGEPTTPIAAAHEDAAERLAALNSGAAEARTLTEALAVDQLTLLTAALPLASQELSAEVRAALPLGILKRMGAIGSALHRHLDAEALAALASHPSDTVRGWWCFALAEREDLSIEQLLAAIKPLADDPRFTVREWVWMAIRPRLVEQLDESIAVLATWTTDPSENVRRFASESLRPRGVWATHIDTFKQHPVLGLPLIEPLRSDPAKYVQDSVANWINDASKTSPKWAREVCARWLSESPTPATARIVKRALRTVGAS